METPFRYKPDAVIGVDHVWVLEDDDYNVPADLWDILARPAEFFKERKETP
jgi:hypothetical protein